MFNQTGPFQYALESMRYSLLNLDSDVRPYPESSSALILAIVVLNTKVFSSMRFNAIGRIDG
jgi:hypothetical protein